MTDGGQNYCTNCGAALAPGAAFCQSCGANVDSALRTNSHIKYRNMWVQVLLWIVTLGLYSIYWYHVSLEEMRIANGKDTGSGCWWTFLLIIPIAQFFAYWHHSFEYSEFIDNRYPGIAIFIIWIVFQPVVWLLVQMDLNRAARAGTPA